MKKSGSFAPLATAIATAVAASLCCLGPLLTLSLGLGSSAASAFLAPWRPVLLVVTFASLTFAWYRGFFQRNVVCSDGLCAKRPGKVTTIILSIGTIVAVATAVFPALAGFASPASVAVSANVVGDRFSVSIPAMDCAACARGIEASLQRAHGVLRARVNYATKRAEIAFDPAVTTRDILLSQIEATGFPPDRTSVRRP